MPQPPWLSYKAEFFFGDHEKTGVSFSAGTQVGNKGRIRPSQFWSSEQKVGKVGGGPQGEKMRGLDYKHQGHSFFFFECLLHPRHFTYNISFNPSNNPGVNSTMISFDK